MHYGHQIYISCVVEIWCVVSHSILISVNRIYFFLSLLSQRIQSIYTHHFENGGRRTFISLFFSLILLYFVFVPTVSDSLSTLFLFRLDGEALRRVLPKDLTDRRRYGNSIAPSLEHQKTHKRSHNKYTHMPRFLHIEDYNVFTYLFVDCYTRYLVQCSKLIYNTAYGLCYF